MYDFKNYIDDKSALIQRMDIVEKKNTRIRWHGNRYL